MPGHVAEFESRRGSSQTFDTISVANFLLHEADRIGIPITHERLQWLLYVAHGNWLNRTGEPLLYGYFEARPEGLIQGVV